ncbi:MAG: hypothetical protein IT337_16265 [Thermomicrobiales bacterium]|nr:hypothetical protein [Thermomicrobiales bacterium]
MSARPFLWVTAVIEILTGLALLARPGTVVTALAGVADPASEALFAGRLAGAALLAIGIGCAIAANARGGRALVGILAVALVYDIGAAALFIATGVGQTAAGPAIWPAAVLHAVLTVWAALCLRAAATEAGAGL